MYTLTDYLNNVGHAAVARMLKTPRQQITQWANLQTSPTPQKALILIRLSGGMLTWQSIYEPFAKARLKGHKKTYILNNGGAQLELPLSF